MNLFIAPSQRRLSRHEILGGFPLALTGAATPGRAAFAQSAEPEFVEVKTSHGRLRGAGTGNLTTFKGISYGGSVSGANRFKAAPPVKPWYGVRDAVAFGAPLAATHGVLLQPAA